MDYFHVWCSVLVLFGARIFCDDLYSKFHQHTYKLKDLRGNVRSYDKDYYNFLHAITYKYNRTTPVFNCTFNHKQDIDNDDLEGVVQVYKFLSNEYRHFPIHFEMNAQKAFRANIAGVTKIIQSCGNLTDCCKFRKNVTYHVCKITIDETLLPPLIPSGQYKVEVSVLYKDKVIAILDGYVEVYTPIAYPKK